MEKFERNGITFTTFVRDGITFLCTGSPTGELKFEFAGEIADYAYVVGATSVVSGDESSSLDELYEKWMIATEFYREVLGIEF